MTLFLNEQEVAQLLPMDECIEALDRAFAHAGAGQVDNKARSRIRMPGGFFHFMAAADGGQGVFGYKAYPSFAGPGGAKMMVMLYDYESGQLLSCMEAGTAGADSHRCGQRLGDALHGAGGRGYGGGYRLRLPGQDAVGGGLRRPRHQAGAGVQPTPGTPRGLRPAQQRARLNVDVQAVDSAQECVEGADIVIAITSAREPVVLGEWLAEGAHVNAAGGNHWQRREIDEAAALRSELIVVDDLEQAKIECGDLMWLEARGSFRWGMAHELRDVVAGRVPGRVSQEGVTLFESMGVALEDIAAAELVYRKARDQGIGLELPF